MRVGGIGDGDGDDSAQSEQDALPKFKDKQREVRAEAEAAVNPAEGINSVSKGRGSVGIGLASDTIASGQASRATTGSVYLHVRPGPRGGEKAVTFAVESLVPAEGATVKVFLDCAGSVNASPLPGSEGLSREVCTVWVT